MFASQVQRNMISVRKGVDTSMPSEEPLSAFEVAVDDRMNKRSEVVVIYEVDGGLVRCMVG